MKFPVNLSETFSSFYGTEFVIFSALNSTEVVKEIVGV